MFNVLVSWQHAVIVQRPDDGVGRSRSDLAGANRGVQDVVAVGDNFTLGQPFPICIPVTHDRISARRVALLETDSGTPAKAWIRVQIACQ
jgi:hypothetical protein